MKESNCTRLEACSRLGSAADRPKSHADIVRKYKRHWRPRIRRERQDLVDAPSLPDAIRQAVLPGGKRHDHQWPIPKLVLQSAADALINANLTADSFGELHEKVQTTIGPIYGIGELTIYDAAQRIGVYLELEPELVYIFMPRRATARVPWVFVGLPFRKAHFRRSFTHSAPVRSKIACAFTNPIFAAWHPLNSSWFVKRTIPEL